MVSAGPIPKTSSVMIIELGEGENRRNEIFTIGNAEKNFLEIAGLELLAGDTFSSLPEASLNNGVIINKTAVEALGFSPKEAIGEKIKGTDLTDTLDKYAQTGKEYTDMLEKIIKQNDLDDFETVQLTNSIIKKQLNL